MLCGILRRVYHNPPVYQPIATRTCRATIHRQPLDFPVEQYTEGTPSRSDVEISCEVRQGKTKCYSCTGGPTQGLIFNDLFG